MNVLIACEESQRVCIAFRELGHRAFSCDIAECSGGHPEWHIKGDVIPLLNGHCEFTLQDGTVDRQIDRWDLIIAHPPCTYLTISGNAWYSVERYGDKARARYKERYKAIVFFMQLALADCDHVAVENPIGIINTAYRKPDQIIQPYEFGHNASKATCLWLKNLQPLEPTEIVDRGEMRSNGFSVGSSAFCAYDENGKTISWNDPRTAKIRSKTFPGIAKAMAEQWSKQIDEPNDI